MQPCGPNSYSILRDKGKKEILTRLKEGADPSTEKSASAVDEKGDNQLGRMWLH